MLNSHDIYSESDSESDSDVYSTSSEDDAVYSPNKFKLAICEFYNPVMHGHHLLETHQNSIYNQYLVVTTIKYISSINNPGLTTRRVNSILNCLANSYEYQITLRHPFIRNYENIIRRNGFKLDIIQNIHLETGESVAILKTFWIRIIQRVWKRIYAERVAIKNKAKSLFKLHNREIDGKSLSILERDYPKFRLGL